MVGQVLGRYKIVEQIGAGGMGVVFRVRDERLGRDLALKVLSPGALHDEASRKRFLDCLLEMRDAERHFGAFRRLEGAAWAPQFPLLSGTPNAETAPPRMNCSALCTRNCTGWRNGNWHDGDLRQA